MPVPERRGGGTLLRRVDVEHHPLELIRSVARSGAAGEVVPGQEPCRLVATDALDDAVDEVDVGRGQWRIALGEHARRAEWRTAVDDRPSGTSQALA